MKKVKLLVTAMIMTTAVLGAKLSKDNSSGFGVFGYDVIGICLPALSTREENCLNTNTGPVCTVLLIPVAGSPLVTNAYSMQSGSFTCLLPLRRE